MAIPDSYKSIATSASNLMFPVSLYKQDTLDGNIPLHMTVKTFHPTDHIDITNLKSQVKAFDIKTPDPTSLHFKPFLLSKSGTTYYLIKVTGLSNNLEALYNEYRDIGYTYDHFIPHFTVDKNMYDKVSLQGIVSSDIVFDPLVLAKGAQIVYEFSD